MADNEAYWVQTPTASPRRKPRTARTIPMTRTRSTVLRLFDAMTFQNMGSAETHLRHRALGDILHLKKCLLAEG
ncbi:MAG TPA: hypothetical protein PLA11_15165, partial [Flavobacteriales bacterium]|nr:hypothetical protein [Flavobacteriales bacterium]